MIPIKENTDYEVGFDLAKIVVQLKSIQTQLDNTKEIDIEYIRATVEAILDSLSKMHDMMSAG